MLSNETKSYLQKAQWTGSSNKSYTYFVYKLPCSFAENQPGNYIFCKIVNNEWVPVYVGQGDLNNRANHHHKQLCIATKGATHFHCHKNAGESARIAEEKDLLEAYIQAYSPSGCNEKIGG